MEKKYHSSCFLNCTIGTKSRKASHIETIQLICTKNLLTNFYVNIGPRQIYVKPGYSLTIEGRTHTQFFIKQNKPDKLIILILFTLFLPFPAKCCKMAKHTLKIVRCEHRKIFKVCLTILQHYA